MISFYNLLFSEQKTLPFSKKVDKYKKNKIK